MFPSLLAFPSAALLPCDLTAVAVRALAGTHVLGTACLHLFTSPAPAEHSWNGTYPLSPPSHALPPSFPSLLKVQLVCNDACRKTKRVLKTYNKHSAPTGCSSALGFNTLQQKDGDITLSAWRGKVTHTGLPSSPAPELGGKYRQPNP